MQRVLPLGCGATRAANELAQIAPALQIVRQSDEAQQRIPCHRAHAKLSARQQLQARRTRRLVRAHHARHRTLIGQRQRRIAQSLGPRHQLLRQGRAMLKAKRADGVQLGIGGGRGGGGHGSFVLNTV